MQRVKNADYEPFYDAYLCQVDSIEMKSSKNVRKFKAKRSLLYEKQLKRAKTILNNPLERLISNDARIEDLLAVTFEVASRLFF